jgi:hypothetical protein
MKSKGGGGTPPRAEATFAAGLFQSKRVSPPLLEADRKETLPFVVRKVARGTRRR